MLILFHPDYTVGSGIAPADPSPAKASEGARGLGPQPLPPVGTFTNSTVRKTKRCLRQAAKQKGVRRAEPLEILLNRSRLRPADDQISR
ncbi:hypothetical protein NL154_07060 [Rhizobium sp. YTUHZ044]|uniref:hypothetical protein n=1 Tax=Rhizobium sp. YTUHZ044 TaxID=2962678 RepID=UPI003DA91C24